MIDGFMPCHADNFKVGSNRKILYIVMHYTGNDGDTALGNCNYYARPKLLTSAHYFVDETSVWQSVKDKDIAYHCGRTDGKYKHPDCRNVNSIGIEMCSRKNADGSYYIKPEVVARAADLVKLLMAQYGIDTAHIVRHYDVTGKECPRPWVRDESLWETFKEGLEESELTREEIIAIVNEVLDEREAARAAAPAADWDKLGEFDKAIQSGLTDGTRPESYPTRMEMAVVAQRTLEKAAEIARADE